MPETGKVLELRASLSGGYGGWHVHQDVLQSESGHLRKVGSGAEDRWTYFMCFSVVSRNLYGKAGHPGARAEVV